MKAFDDFEVMPCLFTGHVNSDGKKCVEPCKRSEAEFWTVYGHTIGEGVEALADCPDEETAQTIANALSIIGRMRHDDICPNCGEWNYQQPVCVDELGGHVVCPHCEGSHDINL